METIADAIAWSGSDVMLSMFAVSKTALRISVQLDPAPVAVRTYVLEDERNVLGGQVVCEHDFVFQRVPKNLDDVLSGCLFAAHAAGARVAWFGFEGSFDFEFLLARGVANQIYAVSDSEGVSLASDDMLSSDEWEARVVRAGIEAHQDSDNARIGLDDGRDP